MPEKKPVDLNYALNLKPKDALEYFESKGYILPKKLSEGWYDVWQESHAKAFTVARVTKMDVLEDIRSMVKKSMDEGMTFQEFKKELEPKLKAKGWWGKVYDEESDKQVQLGSPRRLKTIYNTNLSTSYMAGRYKAMKENSGDRPYWMYDAKNDNKTRPAHKALDGKVFRYDDPFWNTHYPPNGWHCRCNVVAVNEDEIQERNLSVESSKGKLTEESRLVSKTTGEMQPVTVYKTQDINGKTVNFAPDVGWNYNVGKAAYQPELEKYSYKVAKQYVQGIVSGPPFEQFKKNTEKLVLQGIDKAGSKNAVKWLRENSKFSDNKMPIAVLSPEYMKIIGSEVQTVKLSEENFCKNLIEHPEILLTDYVLIPDIIEQAQLIIQDKEEKLVFIRKGNSIYHAALKSTKTGKELFLTSFRKTSMADVKRMKKKGVILKDEL